MNEEQNRFMRKAAAAGLTALEKHDEQAKDETVQAFDELFDLFVREGDAVRLYYLFRLHNQFLGCYHGFLPDSERAAVVHCFKEEKDASIVPLSEEK